MLRHPPSSAPPPGLHRPAGPPKKRGNYNCGRCGLPKKGHVCPLDPTAAPDPLDPTPPAPVPLPPPPRSDHRLRRALSFDAEVVGEETGEEAERSESESESEDEMVEAGGGSRVPASCLAEALRRLSARELMGAAAVCRGWRDCVRRVWISAEEVRLRVTPLSPIGFVASVLHKCSSLSRLALTMERSELPHKSITD